MNSVSSQYSDYVVRSNYTVKYDVGRNGIGIVKKQFAPGEIISAKMVDGQLFFLDSYPYNGVYYFTNIYLDPSYFKLASQSVRNSEQYDSMSLEGILITGFALFFAFMITDEKKR